MLPATASLTLTLAAALAAAFFVSGDSEKLKTCRQIWHQMFEQYLRFCPLQAHHAMCKTGLAWTGPTNGGLCMTAEMHAATDSRWTAHADA